MHVRLSYILLALLLWVQPAMAWFWDSDILVRINGQEYRDADYISWWKNWREPGMEVPQTPDGFINFHLKVQEAEAMELYTSAEYQHKLNVFRKVRSLMLLREEEVLNKIGVARAEELRALYNERYLPRYTLKAARFKTEEQARVFLAALETGTAQEALEAMELPPEQYLVRLEQAYAERLDPAVWEQINRLEAGAWSEPFKWHGFWNLMQVEEEHGYTDAHFEHVRPALEKQWREQRRTHLNRALIAELKAKYKVEIHHEAIAALTPEGVPQDLVGSAAITFDDGSVSLEVLHQAARNEVEKRASTKNNFTYAQALDIVVSDMVAQTLTGFEAMQRHYEQRAPLQDIFTFYSRYRLVKELEKLVLNEEALQVSSAEVEQAYAAQHERFTQAEMLYMARVETREAKLAESLRQQLQRGVPFEEVVRILAPDGVPVRWVDPAGESAALQQALAGLVPGQSGVVEVDGSICFFKLLHRQQAQVRPLAEVEEQLRSELEQKKRGAALDALHARLRAASGVEVDMRVWDRVRKEVLSET